MTTPPRQPTREMTNKNDSAPSADAAQPAEPPATDARSNDDEVICPNCIHQFRAVPVNVQDQLQRQAREIADWKRKYGDANEWGLRNAAAWKYRAERAEAEIESLRAECGLRQIQGYKEGEEAASARLYEAEAEQLTRDMRQRAERAERELALHHHEEWAKKLAEVEAERDALRADADRYRWIRRSDTPSMEVIARKTDEYRVELYFGDELDAAIDAARGKVK